MVKITYVEFDGTSHQAEVQDGTTVMEGAMNNDIPGIVAECGGCLSCATCHIYVDDEWVSATGEATRQESDMLENVMDRQENSRLSCQIEVESELDGLIVRLPELQI